MYHLLTSVDSRVQYVQTVQISRDDICKALFVARDAAPTRDLEVLKDRDVPVPYTISRRKFSTMCKEIGVEIST